ncbi:MAG: FAD-dependent oxidoreductase [Rhodobacteraceae bacterium]|nr:FAD-dependent oxidoreductase [Paracoccaceae bacterium]
MERTDILVVGGGPVGLVLAMEAARRGIAVTVADLRAPGVSETVRCNHVSARTMETFRRLGLADEVRAAGLAPGHAHDAAFRTTFTGREFARIPIPGREGRRSGAPGPDTWWPTPEPAHRVNQIYLEPILQRHAHATPGVRVLHRTEVVSFAQDAEGVTARLRDLETGAEHDIRAAFLAGCDGGRSSVRRAIGAKLEGDAVIQRVQSSYIRAPGLLERSGDEPAWVTICLNTRRNGTLYAIDGRETFLVHNYLAPEEEDFDAVDRDWAIRTILGVGPDFEYEFIHKEDWIGRRLVADKMREGRVFLAGDSAHIWVPYAGYGMNAGIADAVDLAWLLSAVVQGWGGPGMLDAYAAERHPITEQVSRFAMSHAEKMIRNRGAVPPEIEDDTPQGEAARRAFGQVNYDVNVEQYCCAGLNFGYYYEGSPIIAEDGEAAPAYTMGHFTPSTVPGCRMPHVWLPDGRSAYDALGPFYTLVRSDPECDIGPLQGAAQAAGVPLQVLDLPASPDLPEPLLVVRPDQHIAWRGHHLPRDPGLILARIAGKG